MKVGLDRNEQSGIFKAGLMCCCSYYMGHLYLIALLFPVSANWLVYLSINLNHFHVLAIFQTISSMVLSIVCLTLLSISFVDLSNFFKPCVYNLFKSYRPSVHFLRTPIILITIF